MTLCEPDFVAVPDTCPVPQPVIAVRLPQLDELCRRWNEVEPLLYKATHITDCYLPIDVLRLSMLGRCGIWLIERNGKLLAVIATEIREYPRRRVLEMMFCGGREMRVWIDVAIKTFDEHARAAGCSHILCAGRPGWARAWRGRLTGDQVAVRDIVAIKELGHAV
jgi:hypothetical protein